MNGTTATTRTAVNQTWRRSKAHLLNSGLQGSPKFTRALQAVPTARDLGRPQIRVGCAGSDAAAPVLLQDIRYPGCGRRGFWSRSGHRIALHRADSACRKEVRAHTGKALRKVQEGIHGRGARGTLPGTRSPRGCIRATDTEAEAEGYGKVPLFGQGWKTYSQDAVYRERSRPDHPQHQALPKMRTRLQGVQDEAPHVPHESAEPGRFGQGREGARTCGVMATVGIRERRR